LRVLRCENCPDAVATEGENLEMISR
jgi:hypothetical protein